MLFALSSAGSRFDWTDWRLYAVLAFALGCLVSLVAWETRTSNPIIPVRLLASSVIWRSNVVVACFAAALFGSVLYLPLYLQLGRAFGIGASGLLLLPITLSLAASSALIGRRILRTGKLTAYPKRGLAVSTVAFAALAASVAFAPTTVVLALTLLAPGTLPRREGPGVSPAPREAIRADLVPAAGPGPAEEAFQKTGRVRKFPADATIYDWSPGAGQPRVVWIVDRSIDI